MAEEIEPSEGVLGRISRVFPINTLSSLNHPQLKVDVMEYLRTTEIEIEIDREKRKKERE